MDASVERSALLEWFDRAARDLPWRRTRDPYAIWVSEVMLQQTRVDTVVPYFGRFMERFPDAASLARASDDDVMSAWSGLGYYRRARLLHRGARDVVERYGGRVPEDPEARRALPGVGRYTAGAIGSIAFGREEPIVDGNVARVIARLRGIDTPLGRADTEARLWSEAEALVRGPRPGVLNQALMELGATLCSKSSPRCGECPVSRGCVARREGSADRLPVPRPRKAPEPVSMVAVLAREDDAVWMLKSEAALFGGLWGVPMSEGDVPRDALASAGLMRGRIEPEPHAEIEHVLTHRVLTVRVHHARGVVPREGTSAQRVRQRELASLGISALTKRILGL